MMKKLSNRKIARLNSTAPTEERKIAGINLPSVIACGDNSLLDAFTKRYFPKIKLKLMTTLPPDAVFTET